MASTFSTQILSKTTPTCRRYCLQHFGITIKKIQKLSGYEVEVRNKKRNNKEINWQDYHSVYAYNSNILVDALRQGAFVFGGEHSVLNGVCNKMDNPIMPDRKMIYNELADNQFTLREFGDGTAYRLLNEREYVIRKG